MKPKTEKEWNETVQDYINQRDAERQRARRAEEALEPVQERVRTLEAIIRKHLPEIGKLI